jgi:hypothetical protein
LLELELLWSNGQQTFALLALVKSDQPTLVAKYVLKHKIPCDSNGSLAWWACATLRALQRAIKTIGCAYCFHSHPDTALSDYNWKSLPPRARIRKSTGRPASFPADIGTTKKGKKKLGCNNWHLGKTKYGVKVPRNVLEASISMSRMGIRCGQMHCPKKYWRYKR